MGSGIEGSGRTIECNSATRQPDDAITQSAGDLDLMQHQHHGDAGSTDQGPELIAQPPGQRGIDRGKGLVTQEQRRLTDQCSGDADPLALAAAQVSGARLGTMQQADLSKRLGRPSLQ